MTGITGAGSTILGPGSQMAGNTAGERVSVSGNTVHVKADGAGGILEKYRSQGVELELSGEQPEGKFTEEELAEARGEEERKFLQESYQEQAEAAKKNAEAAGEGFQDMARALEISRRLSHGDRVPASDEKFLMDYDKDMYLGAKTMQALAQNEDPKKYKSILEEEEEEGEGVKAEGGEITVDASELNLCQQMPEQ